MLTIAVYCKMTTLLFVQTLGMSVSTDCTYPVINILQFVSTWPILIAAAGLILSGCALFSRVFTLTGLSSSLFLNFCLMCFQDRLCDFDSGLVSVLVITHPILFYFFFPLRVLVF